MSKTQKGICCSIGASILFGSGSTFIKLIYRIYGEIPFQDLALIRSTACLLAFFFIAIKKGPSQTRVTARQLLFYAFAGLCGLFMVQYFLFLGLQLVPVGVCSFIQASSTLMICLYSFTVLHEKPTKSKLLGILFGLVGLSFVVLKKGIFSTAASFGLGILAAFVSGIGKTVYLLSGKKAGKENRRPALMAYGMLFCFLGCIPFANSPSVILHYFSDFRLAVTLLLYVSIFSICPYLLTFRSLELIAASSSGTLNVIEPFAAALSAFLILSEPLSWNQLLGGVLILVCILLIHHDSQMQTEGSVTVQNG